MDAVNVDDLIFDKSVTLSGMSNFPGVLVDYFNLHGDNETLHAEINTSLNNASPLEIEMGEMVLDMYYQDGYVGRVNTTLDMLKQGVNPLNLTGRLAPVPANGSTDFYSSMFSNYVSG